MFFGSNRLSAGISDAEQDSEAEIGRVLLTTGTVVEFDMEDLNGLMGSFRLLTFVCFSLIVAVAANPLLFPNMNSFESRLFYWGLSAGLYLIAIPYWARVLYLVWPRYIPVPMPLIVATAPMVTGLTLLAGVLPDLTFGWLPENAGRATWGKCLSNVAIAHVIETIVVLRFLPLDKSGQGSGSPSLQAVSQIVQGPARPQMVGPEPARFDFATEGPNVAPGVGGASPAGQSESLAQGLAQGLAQNPTQNPAQNPTLALASDVENRVVVLSGTSLPLSQIQTVQSAEHYLIVTTRQDTVKLRARMRDFLAQTPDAAGVHPHRSHWVAADQAQALNGDKLLLLDGQQIPVSRRRKEDVADWFARRHSLS